MKTALVHDWLTGIGGAEKVLQSLYELFPSPIYTLIKNEESLKNSFFEQKNIISSPLQKFPWAKKKYRSYLPFFPWAIEQFDLSSYDLILSSSHAVAKGVLTHADQLHICYCHTPMRYAWDLYHDYLKDAKFDRGLKGKLAQFFLHYLRLWDVSSVPRVDVWIANSSFIARRIKRIYGKEAFVIYPPVDTKFFSPCFQKDNFYCTASRLVPYKRIDLIVKTFSLMPEKKLIVIGDGPERKALEKSAGKNIEFLGYQSDESLRNFLQRAKAFVFAATEDFGILPVEAQACGTPVIAYAKGGVKETVKEQETGLFFKEPTVSSLQEAIQTFEQKEFDPNLSRKNAERFDEERFKKEIFDFIDKCCKEFLEKN